MTTAAVKPMPVPNHLCDEVSVEFEYGALVSNACRSMITKPVPPSMLSEQKWRSHCDKLHKTSLQTMRGRTDQALPETLNIKTNREGKRKQLAADRQSVVNDSVVLADDSSRDCLRQR